MMEIPSRITRKAKTQLFTQMPQTQLKALKILPTTPLAKTRRFECDVTEGYSIRCLKFQMLTEVNSINNSQLKKGQITKKNTRSHWEYTNHLKNTK